MMKRVHFNQWCCTLLTYYTIIMVLVINYYHCFTLSSNRFSCWQSFYDPYLEDGFWLPFNKTCISKCLKLLALSDDLTSQIPGLREPRLLLRSPVDPFVRVWLLKAWHQNLGPGPTLVFGSSPIRLLQSIHSFLPPEKMQQSHIFQYSVGLFSLNLRICYVV